MKNEKNSKYVLFSVVLTVAFGFVFGIPTALIPNPWFARMIVATPLDHIFLALESVLAGSYVALALWQKSRGVVGKCAVSGGILGFLAFACPICNKL